MSRVGLDWYKREPVAYLGDVQGLTSKQHAVYSVVLDLLYVHGGEIRNDPAWIAGWISDMGPAAVRRALADLDQNPAITITIAATHISQKRAKSEAKTKRIQSETNSFSGKKGGKKSAENRRQRNETNILAEANASGETQAEKRREELRDDDDARARSEFTFRDRILGAMGLDTSGLTGRGGSRLGTQADMAEANRWRTDLRLSEDDIVAQVAEVMVRKRDGPPASFRYFTNAMQTLAGSMQAPTLTPIDGGRNAEPHSRRATGEQIAAAADAIVASWGQR